MVAYTMNTNKTKYLYLLTLAAVMFVSCGKPRVVVREINIPSDFQKDLVLAEIVTLSGFIEDLTGAPILDKDTRYTFAYAPHQTPCGLFTDDSALDGCTKWRGDTYNVDIRLSYGKIPWTVVAHELLHIAELDIYGGDVYPSHKRKKWWANMPCVGCPVSPEHTSYLQITNEWIKTRTFVAYILDNTPEQE